MSESKTWQMKVGPGWAHLVDQAVRIARSYRIEIKDIYEKDGELRIDVEKHHSPKAQTLFDFLEAKSATVCEECGKPGKTYKINGENLTRCETCATEALYE